MEKNINSADIIEHPGQIAAFLEEMSRPGGVSLTFEGQGASPLVVILAEASESEGLIIDVTAVADIAGALTAGRAIRLLGQYEGAMLSTESMIASPLDDTPGRLRFVCPYPERMELWHRRDAFRAELRDDMHVAVELELKGVEGVIHAELVNLSLGGCLVRMPLAAAVDLQPEQAVSRLDAIFPNGQRLTVMGDIRHVRADVVQGNALLGIEFSVSAPKLERLTWFLVKETEREAARNALENELSPSPLFQSSSRKATRPPARRARADYATPMARRLAKIADYLNALLVQLQQGEAVDATLLSRYSDQLLGLLDDDREALLFAVVCLHREPPLVQHCLAVAVRLTDLARGQETSRERIKAIMATAMVHDLGKILLPQSLREKVHFDEQDRRRLAEHVSLLRERIEGCHWLDPTIIDEVIGGGNERLDGSGYPAGLEGEALSPLSRMAAVVDVIDAMSRPREDRGAWSMEKIYRHLLTQGERFDSQQAQRYIRHFGLQPIGSLAQFSRGAQGWIQRLDAQGLPRQVAVISPDAQLRYDREVAALGRIESLMSAPPAELLPQQ